MATLNGSASEPQSTLTVPTVGGDTDTWGTILNGTTLQALLNYVLWLHARVPAEAVDTTGAEEGDTLVLQSGVWTPTAAGGGGGTPDWGDIGGTLSDQTDLQNALDAKLGQHANVNSYAGNRTLDNDDSGAYVRITAAGTVTLPDGLAKGFQCVVVNATASDTVALAAATTLTLPAGFEAEIQNRRAVTVIHVGSNVWEVHGALVETP